MLPLPAARSEQTRLGVATDTASEEEDRATLQLEMQ